MSCLIVIFYQELNTETNLSAGLAHSVCCIWKLTYWHHGLGSGLDSIFYNLWYMSGTFKQRWQTSHIFVFNWL